VCGLILYKHRVSFAKTVATILSSALVSAVFDSTAYKLQVQLVRMWLWCTRYILHRQPCDLEIREPTPFLNSPPSPSQLLSSSHRPRSSTCSRVQAYSSLRCSSLEEKLTGDKRRPTATAPCLGILERLRPPHWSTPSATTATLGAPHALPLACSPLGWGVPEGGGASVLEVLAFLVAVRGRLGRCQDGGVNIN
jgi:hypothetical protein